MAPEVHQRFQDYSFPADIWSLGAVISFYCNASHLFANEQMVRNWTRRLAIPADRYSRTIIAMVASMNNPNPRMRPSAKTIVLECGKSQRQNKK